MRDGVDAAALEQRRVRRIGFALALGLLALAAVEIALGERSGNRIDLGEILRGLRAMVGLDAPLDDPGTQVSVELRFWRTATAAGVGACLAVAGALLQGLFRNPLASPSLVGVTAGASLGATLAVLAFGGYAQALIGARLSSPGPWAITAAAFAGALAIGSAVILIGRKLALHRGVATLLLLGVAINTCIAGILSAVQNLLASRGDFETLNALLSWSTGTLTDRKPYHFAMVTAGLTFTLLIVPRVARELDLLATGEDDARSLGVDTDSVHRLVLVAAALTTACAVAAAGQIGFIGLVIPHVFRLVASASHRHLLPLSMLGGAVFVLLTDVAQRLILGERTLSPGPLMSLIGGPFFLVLLVRHLRRRPEW